MVRRLRATNGRRLGRKKISPLQMDDRVGKKV